MPQIPAREFERLPLRVHDMLAGVPLHDAWAIDLPKPREGITLEAFTRAAGDDLFAPSLLVRALLRLRFFVGGLFGWDRERPQAQGGASFADRLTGDDRARSLVPAGARDGAFRVLYRFENEKLVELHNATVHAAASMALFENANDYRFVFAVYVQSANRLTPLYMAAIDPVRRLIVYPSLLRSVRAQWRKAFA